MIQFTKFPFKIRLIKSCELLACRLMKYSLVFHKVYYLIMNKKTGDLTLLTLFN